MNSSTLKYVIMAVFIGLGIAAVLVWAGIVPGLGGGSSNSGSTIKRAELTAWGTTDDAVQFNTLVKSYQVLNPGVKISYEKKSLESYEEELIRAFASGKGPDIFALHNTWLAKYGDLLAPAPQELIPQADLKGTMVDVVARDFMAADALYGVPLAVDTLALYYNTDLFNSAGIVFPPNNWDEFVKDSRLLTKRKPNGDIAISGAAMGAGKNVSYSPDILALLMLQYGTSFINAAGSVNFGALGGSGNMLNPAEAALDFYTSFAKPTNQNYSWFKGSAFTSEDLFAQNRVGMLFGYAGTRGDLIKKSPRLQFAVAPVPQVKNAVFNKNYAQYWGYGVYKNTKNKQAAWEFLRYLLTPQIQEYYGTAMQKASVVRSVIAKQQQIPDLKVFADQALTAVSVNRIDFALLRSVFTQMIESQVSGDQSLRQSLQNAASTMNASLKPQSQ